jgi:nitrile hydratase
VQGARTRGRRLSLWRREEVSPREAEHEAPRLGPGQRVYISSRLPVGHYRVPAYLRGCRGVVEEIIEPAAIDNEEEAFGRNAGSKRHYYRVRFAMSDLWPGYEGSPRDALLVEIFETWLCGEVA